MRLYYVRNLVFDKAESLLPLRKPTSTERKALAMPAFKDVEYLQFAFNILRGRGYTAQESKLIIEAIWNHWWYDLGMWKAVELGQRVYWEVRDTMPVVEKATRYRGEYPDIKFFIVAAAIFAIAFAAYMLIDPSYRRKVREKAPRGLYFGTWGGNLYLMYVSYVARGRNPVYHCFSFPGELITLFEARPSPGVPNRERLYFDNTWWFEGWVLPWFRRWRVKHANVVWLGYLTRIGRGNYLLTKGYTDPNAPRGPWFAKKGFIEEATAKPFYW